MTLTSVPSAPTVRSPRLRRAIAVLALVAVATVSLGAAQPEEADAASLSWGYAGVSVVYTRAETATIASLPDNRAYQFVLMALSLALKSGGPLFDIATWYINDVATSARNQGKCLSFYRPYYLPQLFWARIVPCVA